MPNNWGIRKFRILGVTSGNSAFCVRSSLYTKCFCHCSSGNVPLRNTILWSDKRGAPFDVPLADSKADGFLALEKGRRNCFHLDWLHSMQLWQKCDYFPGIRKISSVTEKHGHMALCGQLRKKCGCIHHSLFCLLWSDFLSHIFWNIFFTSYSSHKILNNIRASNYVPWTSITGNAWKFVRIQILGEPPL